MMIIRLSLIERLLHRIRLLPTPIIDAFGGMVFGRALTIAVRRGVFEAMAHSPRTAGEIASATGLTMKGTELLLESFVVTGYASLSRNVYSLTPESRKWLLKDSPSYLGNLIRYFETLYERWTYLEHSLEHGAPPHRYYEKFTDEDWRVYVLGMRDLAGLLVNDVMKRISLPDSSRHLLDLGGSHGLYAIACCRRYPALTATVVDFEAALRHAGTLVDMEGMHGQVHLLAADFTKDDLPSPQDCVLMFNVIHGFPEEENRALIGRALNALQPGGKLYILDQLREEHRQGGLARFMPLMVGINLLNEIGGNTYSFEQVKNWGVGARSVKRLRLRLPGVSLVEVIRGG